MSLVSGWKARGIVSGERADRLEAVESRRLFSVHDELRALLYGGALLLVAGVSATVKKHFEYFGEAAVVGVLLAAIGGCAAYCLPRTPPFSRGKVPSPTAAYDYAVYVGCALLGVLLAYLETKHALLGRSWDWYLLLCAFLFVPLAYRCDNRLVLALALLDLAVWWGARLKGWEAVFGMRGRSIVYGLAAGAAGRALAASDLKPHFEDTYLTVAVHCVCGALVPGALDGLGSWELWALAAAAGATAAYGVLERRFAFFLYGAGYAYVGFTIAVFKHLKLGGSAGALYFLVSAGAAAALIVAMRRSVAQNE